MRLESSDVRQLRLINFKSNGCQIGQISVKNLNNRNILNDIGG